MDSLSDQPTSLVLELVRNASRDLGTYLGRGPNAYAAGQAALRGIDGAIELLTRTRVALAADIQGERPAPVVEPKHSNVRRGWDGNGWISGSCR